MPHIDSTIFSNRGCTEIFKFFILIRKVSGEKIIKEIFDAIYESLKDEYIPVPTTKEKWRQISHQFEDLWNMPHAVGTLDR